jgi:hypothetical protein
MKKSIFIYQLLTAILFLFIIVLPLFQDITHLIKVQKLESENRTLSEKPKMDIKRLDYFPPQFTAYYNDNFPFRAFFFKFDYRILFKKSPVEKIMIGKNKWLFLDDKEGKVYQGLLSFSENEMLLIIQGLEERMKRYEDMGIKFYIAIAPSTFEIYPEYLPSYYLRTKKTVTDKFCEQMQHTQIPFIYLKEELLKNKTAGQLYLQLDNHWNELGSFFAYKAIIDLIKKDFPEIPSYELTDFEWLPKYSRGGNLVNMLNDNFKALFDEDVSYDVKLNDSCSRWAEVEKVGYPIDEWFPYPWIYEVTGETPLTELPKIVIMRDSYFSSVIPFFYNSFSRAVAIFDSWEYKENMHIVSQEKPDIVLLVIYEPHISNLSHE